MPSLLNDILSRNFRRYSGVSRALVSTSRRLVGVKTDAAGRPRIYSGPVGQIVP